ncbi:MAG: hypothetical protein ACRDNY_10075 [Gaiellaceae bacterium]
MSMTGLFPFLYWYAVTLLLGCVLAFVLPLRPRWLILPIVALAALPSIAFLREGVVESLFLGVSLFSYVLSWTVGVFIGKELRKRMLRRQT